MSDNKYKLKLFNISFIEYFRSVFFLSGITLVLSIWIITPFIDAVFLGKGSFFECLFNPETHDEYAILIFSIAIIAYSFIGYHLLAKSKKLNTAFENSERSLQIFVDNAPAAIALFDREMKYLAYSRRYLIDFELGEQDLTGRSHYEIFPEAPEHWKSIHQHCLSGASETCEEELFVRANGKLEWTRWEIHPWYKQNEEIGGIVFFCEVITKRKEIEKEKNRTFALLKRVINASQDYIFVKDKELRTILCNDVFATALNKRPEELYGNTDIENGWDPEYVKGNPDKAIRGYEQDDKEILKGKTLRIHAESANINNEIRYLETIKSPLKDEDNNIIGVLAIARDITERLQSKKALQKSEQRYRSLIEATTSIIWTSNGTGEFIEPQASWENFTGQPWEEHKGFGWTNMMHPEDVEQIKKAWKKACSETLFYQTSGRLWSAAFNEWRDFEVRAVPIKNPDGSLQEWVGIITDTTERKRSEEALLTSEQRFRRYFELGLMGMAITSLNKDWLEFNDTLAEMFGYTREEFAKLTWPELTYPDDLKPEVAKFERVLAGTTDGYSMEKRFLHKNGSIIHAIISANAVRKRNGEIDYFVALVHDITEIKRSHELLQKSENKYRTLIESSPFCVHQIDKNKKIISMNAAGLKMLKLNNENEIIGAPYLDSVKEEDKKRIKEIIDSAFSGNTQEFEFLCINGLEFKSSLVPIFDQHHKVDRLLGITQDITETKKVERKLNYQASHDNLTGLINRQEFERRAERLLSTINVEKDEHVLCFMDLDQFKVVNDTCGHIAGDEMLRQLSSVLKTVVRKRDTLARLGGDEFGILMEHCSTKDAHRVASTIQNTIQDYQFVWEERIFKVSVSIGLVSIDETTVNFTELLKNADAACYISKETGRNRIHIYNSDDLETVQRQGEMQWVERINRALEENRLCLYAQMIEPLKFSQEKHYELLIRMIDESGNIVSPGAFLPAAERYNLISRIDQWVINNAFNLIQNNTEFVNDVNFFSINLSGQSLTSPEILNLISTKLDESNIEKNKICFEITETTAISNLSVAIKFISELKLKGCQFALDDFGSGLSSFGYLKKLPVDYLKIDGMFVRDIVDDPIDHAMVKSINEIGHVMNMHTIAEFVENDVIKGMLKEIGVDYVQGYGIAKPLPFEKVLTKH